MTSQQDWVKRAEKVLPAAGFGNFDPNVVIRDGRGARVWDQDGKEYVDFLIGSGPMILGHGHAEVLQAVRQQLDKGTTFFANNTCGIELAEEICRAMACADQVRFVSTGSEADMYAMRLARAHTGRNKIMKFEGGYHGMSAEGLMSTSPKKLNNFPQAVPDSAGIPDSVRDNMIVAPFNNGDVARNMMATFGKEIAAVIVEPLQRSIPPQPGFLETLREETEKHGIVLIFDEVVTGFRLAYGGAQEVYGVVPDLCTLGKIIGGGFPLAAIAGKAEIMAHFDPTKVGGDRHTFQIGTLSGNPVAAAAGLKTLEVLRRPGAYDRLRENGQAVIDALQTTLTANSIGHVVVGVPAMFDVVFGLGPVTDYRAAGRGDAGLSRIFNQTLRQQGILKIDSKFYASLALNQGDIDWTRQAITAAAARIAGRSD
jgi:glutamate-1-semialdehyde 2,1-aminomutase